MSTDPGASFLIETFDAAPDPDALAGVLFAEDFDLDDIHATTTLQPRAERPAPPMPPQVYHEAEMQSARLLGFEDGRAAAFAEAQGRANLAAEQALESLTHSLRESETAAQTAARETSAALAASMLRVLAAALPEFCAQHGNAEAIALADTLLPMLMQQPRMIIRANPHTLSLLEPSIVRHQGDDPTRIRRIGTDALAEGDISIEWQDGSAVRDSTEMCRELTAMLAPLGIGAGASPSPPPPPPTTATPHAPERELEHAG